MPQNTAVTPTSTKARTLTETTSTPISRALVWLSPT